MKDVWYWLYTIEQYNEDNWELEKFSGIVAGNEITDAVELLNEYYDIYNICHLEAVADTVFEFEDFNDKREDFKIGKGL